MTRAGKMDDMLFAGIRVHDQGLKSRRDHFILVGKQKDGGRVHLFRIGHAVQRSGNFLREWTRQQEVSAMDLIPIYVSLGLGVGLSLKIPRAKIARDLKLLPLPNCPPLVVAALWQKNLSRSNANFLAQIRQRAQEVERQILE